MADIDDYLRLAADCLVRAKLASDQKTHDIFLHMAQVWDKLAREDCSEDQRPPPEVDEE